MLSGAFWILSQVCAYNAIQAVGYAVGPAVWAGLTICVSFVWGATAFAKPVSSLFGSLCALVLLIIGVCIAAYSTVAPSSYRGCKKVADETREHLNNTETPEQANPTDEPAPPLEDGVPQDATSGPKVKSVPLGLLYACGCGLLNGSLMVPITLFTDGSKLLNIKRYDLGGNPAIAFLPSLAFGIFIVQAVLFFVWFAPTLRTGHWPNFHLTVAAVPGLLTGAFWGMGNFAAMFASTYLGQTIGFPLTQTCIIVNGLWGILYYKEISGPLPVGLFALACCVIIGGAYLNGTYA